VPVFLCIQEDKNKKMATLKRTTSADNDFQKLVILLDKDLAIRDGDEHSFYAQYNKIVSIKNVVVAYINEEAIACGAFKEYDDNTVEIKRMYVEPTFRGKGIAQQVLAELELWAKENNCHTCVLETGKKQPEAIALYTKAGYNIIANYGQYEGVENSVCMRREI
jgi:putative acetyltransferase